MLVQTVHGCYLPLSLSVTFSSYVDFIIWWIYSSTVCWCFINKGYFIYSHCKYFEMHIFNFVGIKIKSDSLYNKEFCSVGVFWGGFFPLVFQVFVSRSICCSYWITARLFKTMQDYHVLLHAGIWDFLFWRGEGSRITLRDPVSSCLQAQADSVSSGVTQSQLQALLHTQKPGNIQSHSGRISSVPKQNHQGVCLGLTSWYSCYPSSIVWPNTSAVLDLKQRVQSPGHWQISENLGHNPVSCEVRSSKNQLCRKFFFTH